MSDSEVSMATETAKQVDHVDNTSRMSVNRQPFDFEVYHIRRVVAGNPNTPHQVLQRLSVDPMPTIRRRVAENPRTQTSVLLQLSLDAHPDVRLAVAENPNTSPEVLAKLATDEDADVRYGVAENPHMPEDILIGLGADENPYVRCRALKTLQMLDPLTQTRLNTMFQNNYKFFPDLYNPS